KVDIPDSSHYVERHIELARLLGLEVGPEDYRLVIPDDVRAFVDNFLNNNGLVRRKFIICNPPTTWVTKHYPVRHWRTVISDLAKEWPIVLTGGSGDTDLNREIADGIEGKIIIASGQTNLEQYMGLIESAALVICPDTGAAFVAAATGTPTVNIFGPSKPSRSGAYRLSEHVTAPVDCQGCLLTKYCPNFICMDSIDPKTVIDAAQRMLALKIES
ncbi:MAG: glycosyltransferase family 9 protein, partial [bacterium]